MSHDEQAWLIQSLRQDAAVSDAFYLQAVKERDQAKAELAEATAESEILANLLVERDQVVQDLTEKYMTMCKAAVALLAWADVRGWASDPVSYTFINGLRLAWQEDQSRTAQHGGQGISAHQQPPARTSAL